MFSSDLAEKVVVVTTTYYNPKFYQQKTSSDFIRARLAVSLIQCATKAGYVTVVVDGLSPEEHSPPEVLQQFEEAGAKVYLAEERGMGKHRRQVIRKAYELGRPVIVWTEPEKSPFIPELWKIVEPIQKGKADFVIPRRKSLQSYPTAQQYAEAFGNLFWKQLTGCDLDVWFGVCAWQREHTSYFLNYTGEYGDLWESLYIPILEAVMAGKKLDSVNVNYVHSQEQKQVEEDDTFFTKKRLVQLDNIIPALERHWRKYKPSV